MKLPRQSFLALAAIGWVDGSLQRIEAEGLLRAAREAELSPEDLAEVENATKAKIELGSIGVSGMSEWEQALTYALAAWFAQLDGVVSTSEATTMSDLGDQLGLADPLRKRAAAAAYDIACLPGGGKPERYDFQKLAARLRERLPQLK
jgi:putative intracellular protease/amidase